MTKPATQFLAPAQPFHPDDVVVWFDGFSATVGDVRRGDFNHRSDDYEIVRADDIARLQAPGIVDVETDRN